ncbi:MAG: hypothetical protein NC548_62030 [Lachnospiraceae bacterium]|nr:hypothetical protein [Lachnospiraceae bacterium]MCM1230959.1 hypothetical protein [Ruminococcus flavefaciens]
MTFRQNQLEECLGNTGCSEKEKAEILKCYDESDIQQIIHLLRLHRKVILDTVHIGEKQISCLDYLVFQLEKEIKADY